MTAQERLLLQLTNGLGPKPQDTSKQSEKKAYSERASRVVAMAISAELRLKGLEGARPTEAGLDEKSGAERRMAGGIGAKRVDVTWATEESGLLLAFSIKTINFKDSKTGNFQKNLTNRRGDLLFESITLHRRFPYAVLVGIFILDENANLDDTASRKSTFANTHDRLALFTGRVDPSGRDEQFEHLYIGLLSVKENESSCNFYRVGQQNALPLDNLLDEILLSVSIRNADMYSYDGAKLKTTRNTRNGD